MSKFPALTDALLTALPKTDLHVHLDGSLRAATLLELADRQGVKLPAADEAGLLRTVFKARYRDLPDYLRGFAYTCAVVREAEAIERVTRELCEDSFAEGTRYLEIRFAPQLLAHPQLPVAEVLAACGRGIAAAERARNRHANVARDGDPPFRAGIVVCAMRHFAPVFGPAYAAMFAAFPNLPQAQIFALASEELVRESIRARDAAGLPIVGLDLAGQEKGYPAKLHARTYQLAHDAFLGKTVHAGEDYGPESIFQAITDCHADRIGHGTWLFSTGKVISPQIADRADFVRRLVQYLAERRVTLEVCLTSNLQTIPSLHSLARHPFKKMLASRLSVTLCTDNRLVSRTTMVRELRLAVDTFHLNAADLRRILIYGFKRSFYPGPYLEKRAYVRSVIDLSDRVLAAHGLGPG
jgi:adenosine deaminase